MTKNYHYEVELVAALKSGGSNIPSEQALDHVYGYAVGLDMTRRDLQRAMGDEKKPWEIGKSFDRSAVLGPIHPATKTGHFTKGAISLAVNDAVKQNSNLQNMIWRVAEQISKLSEAFELKAGDIIYSGTPENVGPVVKGDVLLCKIEGPAGYVDQDCMSKVAVMGPGLRRDGGAGLRGQIGKFRMLAQIIRHKTAARDDPAAVGADQVQGAPDQFGGDAAAA